MNLSASHELQKKSLRLRLQSNRLMHWQNTSAELPVDDDEFPRSHTMRLLFTAPGIVSFLIVEVAPFLLSRYLAKRKGGDEKS